MSSFWGFSVEYTSNRSDWFLLPNVLDVQLPKEYDGKRFPLQLSLEPATWKSLLSLVTSSRSIYSCIDLDCEPRVFESISDRNTGSLNLRLLIFSWLSGELFAVNMKHYPPSSGIQRWWKLQSDERPLSSVKLVLCGWIVLRCGLLPDGIVQPRFWPRRTLGCIRGLWGFHGDTITANILKRLFIINHMAVDLWNTVVILEEPKVLFIQQD